MLPRSPAKGLSTRRRDRECHAQVSVNKTASKLTRRSGGYFLTIADDDRRAQLKAAFAISSNGTAVLRVPNSLNARLV
jgi:hypothetical protein